MVEGRTTADNGGQRPQERVEGATSLEIQILFPYLTLIYSASKTVEGATSLEIQILFPYLTLIYSASKTLSNYIFLTIELSSIYKN